MKRLTLAIALLVAGCASAPREQLPAVSWRSETEALEILAHRAESVKTLSSQGLMTMRRPDGQSVRLDVALVADARQHLRLRAWKLGRAVFDLTMNESGMFMLLPDDPSIRERVRQGQLNIKRVADSWELFNGRFFTRRDVTTKRRGDTLLCSATVDDAHVTCEVDGQTLTPRRYLLRDADGKERFSLALSNYKIINDIPFARRYAAKSEFGEIVIETRDVELNDELAPAAFTPPRRAEKLP
jgi:outer membrane lipoprotein-sorting protein